MSRLIEELRSKGAYFIMLVVQGLNLLAVAVGSIVLGLHELYPGAIADFTASLSPTAKVLLLAGWGGLVHFFLRQAKKSV